jgi:hypothetical protein
MVSSTVMKVEAGAITEVTKALQAALLQRAKLLQKLDAIMVIPRRQITVLTT